MIEKQQKTIAGVMFSGGLDSAATLVYALNNYDKVLPICFGIGGTQQRIEAIAQEKVWRMLSKTRHYKNKLLLTYSVNVKDVFRHSQSALQTGKNFVEGEYDEKAHEAFNVPYRNVVFASISTSIIESFVTGAYDEYNGWRGVVLSGVHGRDNGEKTYLDCEESCWDTLNELSRNYTYSKIFTEAPFVNLTKAGVVLYVADNAFCDWRKLIKATASCYNPTSQDEPCGKCPTCIERTQAIEKAEKEFR